MRRRPLTRKPTMDDTIVTVRFTDAGQARGTLHELKRLDRDGQLRVRGAALVERSGQGRIGMPPGTADADGLFMPQGGLVGALGGTATRRPAAEVAAEVRAAEEAAKTADEAARRVLGEERRDQRKDQWERFKETMKSKLP